MAGCFAEVLPGQHLVDSAYVEAGLLLNGREKHGIIMVGPTRKYPSWQARAERAYDHYQFEIDWERERIRCPQGKVSKSWYRFDSRGKPLVKVLFREEDSRPCQARHLCTKGAKKVLQLPYRVHYEALKEQRRIHASEEGRHLYNKRADVEGTISQGVRAFGLRRARYRGLAKTHLQLVATAAAINLERLVAWFDNLPRGKTRVSRFTMLAPVWLRQQNPTVFLYFPVMPKRNRDTLAPLQRPCASLSHELLTCPPPLLP